MNLPRRCAARALRQSVRRRSPGVRGGRRRCRGRRPRRSRGAARAPRSARGRARPRGAQASPVPGQAGHREPAAGPVGAGQREREVGGDRPQLGRPVRDRPGGRPAADVGGLERGRAGRRRPRRRRARGSASAGGSGARQCADGTISRASACSVWATTFTGRPQANVVRMSVAITGASSGIGEATARRLAASRTWSSCWWPGARTCWRHSAAELGRTTLRGGRPRGARCSPAGRRARARASRRPPRPARQQRGRRLARALRRRGLRVGERPAARWSSTSTPSCA